MLAKSIEWAGALTGLMGSALLAVHTALSGYGFLLFLASNFFWVWFGLKTRAWGMVTMQLGFTVTSVVGVFRWLG